MRSSRTQFVISMAIGSALVYYVLHGIDIAMTWQAVTAASPWYLVAAFGLMVVAYIARGARWLIWNRSLTFADSLKAILVGFMGNNVLPVRFGEVLRADWVAARSKDGRGRSAALSSIAAERILDGAILSGFAVFGVLYDRVDGAIQQGVLFASALFGVLSLGLLVAVFRDATIRRMLAALNAVFPGHLTTIAKTKANYMLDGIVQLRSPARLGGALAATLGIWLLELGLYWTLARGLAPLDVTTALMLVAVVNFASLFPLTVGGIGAIESAATAFLTAVGIPPHQALALVLVQHAFQLMYTTTAGAAIYLLDRRRGSITSTSSSEAGGVQQPDVMSLTRVNLAALANNVRLQPPGERPSLSIVIPAYNEKDRLPRTALQVISWCKQRAGEYEIIIVDDGSTDDTLAVAELLEEHDRSVRKIACPHKGKGAAVRMGMLNARGKYVLFMDADGATPLTEIAKLTAQLDQGYDVAIGSRVLQVAGEAKVETSLHRRIIGRVFALFVNVFAVSGIADTQCGFKMFRREVTKVIFGSQRLDGFAFDVEILFLARRMGLSISEIAVNWQHQAGSKVNLVTDSLQMLRDLMRIRWLHKGGVAVKPSMARVGEVRS